MGETGCAYLVLNEGAELAFDDLIAFLGETGMAKQKYPERIEIIEAFPRTAAGKIRKNLLRDEIAGKVAKEAADKGATP
jgi:non-ribosomal peptide synthetase component E (peptide arylation enzyme)